MAKIYLAIIGLIYLALAAWCALSPAATAKALGYGEMTSAARSEYFVLYGGLQTALGIVFLWPLLRSIEPGQTLLVCLIVHGCIALFRAGCYLLYSDIPTMTQILTGVEWSIFLSSAYMWWKS